MKLKCDVCGGYNGSCNRYRGVFGDITICPSCLVLGSGKVVEAAELSQAALKLIRAKSLSGNPTPISEEEAEAKVLVEIKPITRKPRTGRKQWKAVMKNA